jgi:hypothetical protein
MSTVLNALSRKSMTCGWDVLVGYNAAAVNKLFAQQFVANTKANQNLPTIKEGNILIGGLDVGFMNLIIGPPLISFSGDLTSQQAIVTMNFLSGRVFTQDQNGKIIYLSSYQDISPVYGFGLQMVVPLQQAEGSINNQAVTVDLSKANTYQCNLLSASSSAASLLGMAFSGLLNQELKGGLSYQLGTIVTGSTSENLTPVNFNIRTQPAPGSSSDGAVLLLVATTYNRVGGNSPGLDFPYLIPDSYGAFVLVASKTLFTNIIGPAYSGQQGNPTATVSDMTGSNPACYLNLSGGTITCPGISGSWSSGDVDTHRYWTGGRMATLPEPVTFGFDGLKIEPQSDSMSITWNGKIYQQFTSEIVGGRAFSVSSQTVTLAISASLAANPNVGSNDVVGFAGQGTPTVTAPKSSPWWIKWLSNNEAEVKIGGAIANAAQPVLQSILNFPLPQVNAFAVSSLLFPPDHALSFQNAYVPGDLALFGQVNPKETAFMVSPFQSTVAPLGQVQFSTGSTVTWSINPRVGSISSGGGLYTAPAQTTVGATNIVVTATDQSNDTATAILTLVPYPVAVCPAFVMVNPNQTAQQFSAAVLGGESVTWSIDPSDGSVGTLSSTGLYTVPASFPATFTLAKITATTSTGAVASAVVMLNSPGITMGVTPPLVSLGAGSSNAFTVTPTTDVSWQVLGTGGGTVSQDGLYAAPLMISSPSTDIVLMTYTPTAGVSLYGIAIVALDPALETTPSA